MSDERGRRVSDEEDVIQAIVDSMETDAWVAREFYRGSDSDRLSWGWDSFKEAIKHRTRYFFLEGEPHDDMPPARMLEKIADTIRRWPGGMDLIRRLPSDTNILRISIVAAGCTAWATHFIILLAFEPGVPAAFDPLLTSISALCAIGGIGAGIMLSLREDQ